MTNKIDKMLVEGSKVINLGLTSFAETCETQGVKVTHVQWKPPAGGDPELIELLDKLL
ncbi:MAG: fdrA domain protein [Candidatus Hodarchaeales archaeon]